MSDFESFVGVNPWTALFTFCNMMITFLVLKHFLFGPVKKMIDDRQKEIDTMYATLRAQKREQEIVDAARASARAMRDAAEADIEQEKKKAVNELKDEIGGIAMDIASRVVEREISEQDHRALIDEFIRNVGDAS